MIGLSVGWIRNFRRFTTETVSQIFAYKNYPSRFLPPSPPTTTSYPRSDTSPSSFSTQNGATMFNIANRTASAWRSVQRAAAGMATAARIGDTKVPMSLLEPGWYINYQRIADNLAIVRDRWVIVDWPSFSCSFFSHVPFPQVKTPSYLVRKDSLWSFG
jgi:hypothetical protein